VLFLTGLVAGYLKNVTNVTDETINIVVLSRQPRVMSPDRRASMHAPWLSSQPRQQSNKLQPF